MRTRVDRRPVVRRTALLGGSLLAVLASVSACGGDGGGSGSEVASLGTDEAADDATETSTEGTAAGPTDPQEAALAFAECMRDHGIDMPDPKFNENGGEAIDVKGGPSDMKKMEAADKACQPLMENVEREVEMSPEEQAERQEQMLTYAACMRGEGIDMPDPTFDEDGGTMVIRGGPASGGDGSDDGSEGEAGDQPADDGEMPSDADNPRDFTIDPDFEAADKKCADEAGMDDREGGGPMLSTRQDGEDD